MYVHVPPEEIESRSLAIIDAEVAEPRPFAGEEWAVARRSFAARNAAVRPDGSDGANIANPRVPLSVLATQAPSSLAST